MAKTDDKNKSKSKKAKDASGRKLIAQNKKARHDYLILDTYECGIVLTGTEVKSLRQGRASLVDGFAQLDGGEAGCTTCTSRSTPRAPGPTTRARRKRKLLLHRAEIDKLIGKTQETGHTLVPLALYFLNGRAKVEIALAKGKKEYDKRQTLREKQDRREADRAISAAQAASASEGVTTGVSGCLRRRGPVGRAPLAGTRPGGIQLAPGAAGHVPWSCSAAPRERAGCQLNMGMIGFDSGCRSRGSEPRNAAMISLTMCRKKIIANHKRDSFALAA